MIETWHNATRKDNYQGLVISDITGENIAVTYNPDNAPIVSTAPELYEACKRALPWLTKALAEHINEGCALQNDLNQTIRLIQFALNKAEGN